jgi:hypothetical protein
MRLQKNERFQVARFYTYSKYLRFLQSHVIILLRQRALARKKNTGSNASGVLIVDAEKA